jgi:thiosulfate/3-mercaptopyruvate sulfurtransferase
MHLYFRELLNEDDSFKSPDQLRGVLAAAGVTPENFDDVVCYCRLSHRATIGWIALSQILGHSNVKIYDGSWTEWAALSATRSRSSAPALPRAPRMDGPRLGG